MSISTPYNQRVYLQEEEHLRYGPTAIMTNIDGVELDIDGNTLAYVEFKNPGEYINMFLLRGVINDATTLKKPFYLTIFYREPIKHYFIIPMNECAKQLPNMDQPRWWSVRQYVQHLINLRGRKTTQQFLDHYEDYVPADLTPPILNIRLKC